MRFEATVTLGNVLVILTIISVSLGLATLLLRFFGRVYEMFGWVMEMYFHFCQQSDPPKPVPDWLYQRYRTINGNATGKGKSKSVSAGQFK